MYKLENEDNVVMLGAFKNREGNPILDAAEIEAAFKVDDEPVDRRFKKKKNKTNRSISVEADLIKMSAELKRM